MQEKNVIYFENQDSLDLRELFFFLMVRKYLIAGLTGFITLLVTLYLFIQPPIYQATSSFTKTSDSSITNLNKLLYENETKESVYITFLSQLISRDLQKEVFVENGFLTRFNKDSNPIDDVNRFIESSLRSISVIEPAPGRASEIALIEKPLLISMKGKNPSAISDYLDALVTKADVTNLMTIVKINQQKISTRLDQISLESSQLIGKAKQTRLNRILRMKEADDQKIREINDRIKRLRYKAKEDRLNNILLLTSAAKLANSLGIFENNFKQFNDEDKMDSNFSITVVDSNELPEWYLYGEKALLQRIKLLNDRSDDDPFIPELIDLTNQLNEVKNNNILKTLEIRQDDIPFIPELINLSLEKDKLTLMNIILLDSSSINLIKTAMVKNISKDKKFIILIAFIGSFFMSILLALILGVMNPNKKTPA